MYCLRVVLLTLETIGYSLRYIVLSIVLGPSGRITHVIGYIAYIGLFGHR